MGLFSKIKDPHIMFFSRTDRRIASIMMLRLEDWQYKYRQTETVEKMKKNACFFFLFSVFLCFSCGEQQRGAGRVRGLRSHMTCFFIKSGFIFIYLDGYFRFSC